MPTTTYSQEEVNMIVSELKKQLLPDLINQIERINKLPPLLTRKQFMEVAGIKDKKCNELFNRADFYPLTRKLGHPRVDTEQLFKWINEDEHRKEIDLDNPYLAM
ncbi:hypothetical protein [Paraliobacillus ryukyuensis]|uniref:hypothetical protein n=1 Tax=Paraliobacillus ryukyuensis TaxID=200904 RepID=UPI0009A77007|nr:hypothetical protein [Paraliobacillus ryukyuensis]